MIIVAEHVSTPIGGKAGEGVWRVWVDDPPRPIEATLIPNGDHADDRWIAAAADHTIGRRVGGSGATPAHALAEIIESISLWRLGRMPRMAVTADPRIVLPEPTIVAPHEARPEPGAKSTDRFAPTAIVPNAPATATIGAADPGSASGVAPSARAQKLAAIAKARRTTKEG